MHALTTPAQIDRYRLLTLRAAVRLETLGMTRKGQSATTAARVLLGLPKSARRDVVLAALNTALEQ